MVMDKRKYFNISSFPNFIEYLDENNLVSRDERYEYYDTALIAEGFKSAQFHEEVDEHISWSMSEEEFTWFILKWS